MRYLHFHFTPATQGSVSSLYYIVLHDISFQNARLVEDGAKLQTTLSRLREASTTQACTQCTVGVCVIQFVGYYVPWCMMYGGYICCVLQTRASVRLEKAAWRGGL